MNNKDFEPTTFNMDINLKTKAKMYTAQLNMKSRKEGLKSKKTLGKLLNEALDYYLSDIKLEG